MVVVVLEPAAGAMVLVVVAAFPEAGIGYVVDEALVSGPDFVAVLAVAQCELGFSVGG